MHIEKNTLFLTFKTGPEKDLQSCLALLKEILSLSQVFRNKLSQGSKSGKKLTRTRRIRVDIKGLVNKTNTSNEMVGDLIAFIRQGKITRIKTFFGNKEFVVNSRTNFDKLLVDLLINKPVKV